MHSFHNAKSGAPILAGEENPARIAVALLSLIQCLAIRPDYRQRCRTAAWENENASRTIHRIVCQLSLSNVHTEVYAKEPQRNVKSQ
jgi:hypothetical protein